MSLIPKIALGTKKERSKANLSFDSQTTANIGFVQPTMARMLVPNSSIEVKNRTLVRMSPLVNPTFGRLSQRDYFCFVKMSDIYRPWAEFLSGKNFTPADGLSYIPTALPRFRMADIVALCMASNSYIGVSPAHDVHTTLVENSRMSINDMVNLMDGIRSTLSNYTIRNMANNNQNPIKINFASTDTDALDPFGASAVVFPDIKGRSWCVFSSTFTDNCVAEGLEEVNYENSDITIFVQSGFTGNYIREDGVTFDLSNGVYLHFKLKSFARNLRKIFIGLGYGFNLWDTELYTPFKLLAYYKAWFDTFVPLRNYQFTDTIAYRVIKRLESSCTELDLIQLMDAMIFRGTPKWQSSFYYYTSPDYFSASLYNLGDNSLDNAQRNTILSPMNGNVNSYDERGATSRLDVSSTYSQSSTYYALGLQMMLRLMRFTNKNNVIGRSIREYAKVHYGIDDLESDNKSVTKINSHRVDINFDDVMNLSASKDAYLGEYAGKGLGYKESDKSYFTTEDFGFFFCMSVIVPETGYFQGSLKENKIADKFEFFTPEFDALGYDVITRGEILNDFDSQGPGFSPSSFDTIKGFGFIPRYSHFKVGRNIVNGDLSLKSTRNGLQGYYLDKEFKRCKVDATLSPLFADSYQISQPDYLPTNVSDNIRRIDPSDNVGNYNRIFQYTSIDVDHFIIQKVFDVDVTAPWKSLSDSFETVQQDESVINRNHQ